MYKLFKGYYSNNYKYYDTIIISSIKYNIADNIYVIFNNQNLSEVYDESTDNIKRVVAFSYLPLHNVLENIDDFSQIRIMSFEEQINSGKKYGLSMEGITEITEDEYYKID